VARASATITVWKVKGVKPLELDADSNLRNHRGLHYRKMCSLLFHGLRCREFLHSLDDLSFVFKFAFGIFYCLYGTVFFCDYFVLYVTSGIWAWFIAAFTWNAPLIIKLYINRTRQSRDAKRSKDGWFSSCNVQELEQIKKELAKTKSI
jgi:hypothetical protein